MPLDITVPTANGIVDERNRLWLVKSPFHVRRGKALDDCG
jgi:hypothetical protein